MTVVNPKSISGINSITMASGSDDLLTIHSNNTTERVRVNNSGDVIVGSGITLSPDGDIFFTGIATGNGSGLTNLATDLVNDTSPQLGGNLDNNGKNITFGDSAGSTDDRLTFGAGTDLSIYHDNSNSRTRIEHSTDNALEILQGGNAGTLIQNQNSYNIEIKTNAEDAIKCVANGAVELYHDGTKQCETSANGLAFPSGKGIDFSATSDLSGSSSELLDDYEEGTYTCVLTGSTGGSHNIVGCPYVKIGKQVSIQVTLANPGSNSISGYWSFTMPFQAVQSTGFAYFGGYVTYTRHMPGFSAGDGNFTNYALHTYNGQSSAILYKLRNGSGEANLITGSLSTEAILAWTMVYNTST